MTREERILGLTYCVRNSARAFSRSRSDFDELIDVAWIAAIEALDRLDSGMDLQEIESLMMVILRRRLIDHLRREVFDGRPGRRSSRLVKIGNCVPLEGISDGRFAAADPGLDEATAAIDVERIRRRFRPATSGPGDRSANAARAWRILVLHYGYGLDHPTIATSLGLSHPGHSSRIAFKSMRRIRAELQISV